MNARYALINATPMVGEGKKKRNRKRKKITKGEKEKDEEKSKKRTEEEEEKEERKGTNATVRRTTSSSGEAPIKFHLAVQSLARIAGCRCYFLFRRGGELICANDTLPPCLPASFASSRFLFPSGSRRISVSRSCHVRQKLACFSKTISKTIESAGTTEVFTLSLV